MGPKVQQPDCDYDGGKRHLDTQRAFTVKRAAKVQTVGDVGELAPPCRNQVSGA